MTATIPTQTIVVLLFLLLTGWTLGMVFAPVMAKWLYAASFWKQKVRTVGPDGKPIPIFAALHKDKEVNTPRAGGLMIWLTVASMAFVFWVAAHAWPASFWASVNFLTRRQTLLPLFTLVAAGAIGFLDDWLVVRGKGSYVGGGLNFWYRLSLVTLLGLIGAFWFYVKLDWSSVVVPFLGAIDLHWFFIPFFVLVMLASFSSGIVDGLDGLSGGVFATIFFSYAALAVLRGQYQLAGFLFVIVGTLIAYLWFNIPPARFYMGETGILALSTTLTVVAFLTNGVVLLPIIACVLVMESGSVIIQQLSKKFRGKKVFLSAPIHHHFEAKGWPAPKVTMRFWLLSALGGLVGVALSMLAGVLQ